MGSFWLGFTVLAVFFGKIASAVTLPELTVREELEIYPQGLLLDETVAGEMNRLRAHPSLDSVIQISQSASPQFRIRGSEPHQNRVLIEGIPLTDPVYHSDQLVVIPSGASSFWELYPAGSPAFFMEEGTGGAINIRLFKPLRATEVSFQTGSFGFNRLSGHLPKVLGAQLAIEYLQSQENFPFQNLQTLSSSSKEEPMQKRENNGFLRVSVLPQWVLWQRSQFQGQLFSINSFQKTEIPGPISQPMTKSLESLFHLTGLQVKGALGEGIQSDNIAYVRVVREWLKERVQEDSEESRYFTGGLQTKVTFPFAGEKLRTGVGANMTGYHWKKSGKPEGSMEYTQLKIPFFLDSKIILKNSSLEIRPEMMGALEQLSSQTDEKKYLKFSPRISLIKKHAGQKEWVSSLGYYFRNPSLSELMGGPQGALANPQLKSESSLKLDLTWNLPHSRLSFYVAKMDQLIQGQLVDQRWFQSENIGTALFAGAEASNELTLSRFIFLSTGGSVLRAANQNPSVSERGKTLPFRFPFKAFAQIDYRSRLWSAGIRNSLFGPSYLDKENTRRISSYFLFDFFGELDLGDYGKCLLNIENLLDLTLVDARFPDGSVLAQLSGMNEYPAAGRRIYLKWTVDL